ncbi:ATP-dependent DNA ligase [Streptomyces sp. NBC_00237]|uniref:ATP-dependent DNA ligase n=1 Tax=Streptomyces sp. NBC_00237 TaxID=2975687 RepID=UPI00224F9832|nr:ATP-dependent DNA ligase [Streptomyces sp. NBC_00237]MCX5202928.1 ATP-dependent DNA ligase [Streptomyces sp. NBC_00237]
MNLPVMPPVKPMLAKAVKKIPPGMQYEAKWDGFRAIVHRDGDALVIGSRTGKPLTRYFPELAAALLANLPARCVVDGEIVIAQDGRLDFERLSDRIHPADSRITLLAERTPASFVAFDLLALEDLALFDVPLEQRRAALVEVMEGAAPPVHLAPATTDVETARVWFERFEGAGLDGVMAKPLTMPYRPDARLMYKIKHERTADCVVAGYRLHKTAGPVVGSLLLGLYDEEGVLQHVGAASAFTMQRRQELVAELEPLRLAEGAAHPWADWEDQSAHETRRLPGSQNRWNGGKDQGWVALEPSRVVEVAYDHMQGTRFRHTVQFRRWRPDRDPSGCTYAQLEEPVSYDLAEVLSGSPTPGSGG